MLAFAGAVVNGVQESAGAVVDYVLRNDKGITEAMGDHAVRGGQQVQENQRPTSHKDRRTERQDGRAGATGVRDEGKRGSGDRGKGSREYQVPTQQGTVEGRQKRIGDAKEKHDGHIKEMERKIDGQRRQITGLMQEVESLREGGKRKDDKIALLEQEQSKLHQEIEDLRKKLERSQRHGQQQLLRQEEESKILQTESQQLKAQYAHTAALLETRTSELKGAQAFLAKADSLSGAEVTSMVEGLNSEILQTAAFMADSFEFTGALPSAGMERNEAWKRVKPVLGYRMSMMLISVQHSEDPMLVQIALQSFLVCYCVHFIRAWSLEESPHADDLLEKIYQRVRQAEDQIVSGNWRALTHRHVRTLPYDDPNQTSALEMNVVRDLSHVLITAGCRVHYQEVLEIVWAKFGDKIKAINKASFRLNQVLREEITSGDIEPVCILPDVSFDPSGMEDIGGERVPGQQSDRVLCTTEMGLQRVVRQMKKNRSWSETKLLLKPKVALESVTDSMSKCTVEGVTVTA